MRISYGTKFVDQRQSEVNGYGYAAKNMLESLTRCGYEVNHNDPTADVEIWFDQPEHWKFSDGPYKIGYHPWESTQLLRNRNPDWVETMNKCDEIWTPSPLIAKWYKEFAGIEPPVHVYEHGVSPDWTPKERVEGETFKFLHVGGEAARKGLTDAMKGLRLAFPNNEPVELTAKIMSRGWNMGSFRRITYLNEAYSLPRLIQLFHDHHAYVYPSYGEGFGLTPLQAMATGMPTLTLPGWAPYSQFLDNDISIKSKLDKSPWPVLHPGMMFKPDIDSLIESMREVYSNYEVHQARAQAVVKDLVAHYDWDRLTAEAFGNLEERLKSF